MAHVLYFSPIFESKALRLVYKGIAIGQYGHHLYTASNLEESVRKLEENPIAIALLGLSNADRRSLELLPNLEQIAPQIPVFICSKHLQKPELMDILSNPVVKGYFQTMQEVFCSEEFKHPTPQ